MTLSAPHLLQPDPVPQDAQRGMGTGEGAETCPCATRSPRTKFSAAPGALRGARAAHGHPERPHAGTAPPAPHLPGPRSPPHLPSAAPQRGRGAPGGSGTEPSPGPGGAAAGLCPRSAARPQRPPCPGLSPRSSPRPGAAPAGRAGPPRRRHSPRRDRGGGGGGGGGACSGRRSGSPCCRLPGPCRPPPAPPAAGPR